MTLGSECQLRGRTLIAQGRQDFTWRVLPHNRGSDPKVIAHTCELFSINGMKSFSSRTWNLVIDIMTLWNLIDNNKCNIWYPCCLTCTCMYLSISCTWNECSMCNNYFDMHLGTAIVSFFMFGGEMLPPLSQLSAMQLLLLLLLFTYYCDSALTSQINLVKSDGCLYASAVSVPWWSIWYGGPGLYKSIYTNTALPKRHFRYMFWRWFLVKFQKYLKVI